MTEAVTQGLRPWDRIVEALRPLSDAEKEALRESIESDGVQLPVLAMPDGRIIDGHHRWAIAPDACRIEILDLPEEDAFRKALALNTARRQITPDQLADLEKWQRDTFIKLRAKGKTQDQAARAVGIDQSTGSRWENEHNMQPHIRFKSSRNPLDIRVKVPQIHSPQILHHISNGISPKQVAANFGITEQHVHRIAKKEASRQAKEQEREANRSQAADLIPPSGVTIEHRDFVDQASGLPDNSVALIFTDPPYTRESVPVYGQLAEIACRVLMPGGSLLCYCGQYLVPEIYPLMISERLRPWWIIAISHQKQFARMREYGIVVKWKPILWFVKDHRGHKGFVDDLTIGQGREKDGHPWQQGEAEAAYWIEALTEEGDLVWDPFCGSGTTAAAAHGRDRLVMTCDTDESAVNTARNRLALNG